MNSFLLRLKKYEAIVSRIEPYCRHKLKHSLVLNNLKENAAFLLATAAYSRR